MPTSYETINQSKHGDCSQTTAIETEEGSLRVTIVGPSGGFELEIESRDDLPAQVKQLGELAAAVATARTVLAPYLDVVDGGPR